MPREQGTGNREPTKTAGGEAIQIPAGDVLIRRVRGPAQATNVYLGLVRTGRIYCTDIETAAVLCGAGGEFEPLAEHVAEVEAAKAKTKSEQTPK